VASLLTSANCLRVHGVLVRDPLLVALRQADVVNVPLECLQPSGSKYQYGNGVRLLHEITHRRD
jgi:hypothetical protein